MLKLNGLEFEIDFTDADVQEKYEKACQVIEPLAQPEKGLTAPQMIRKAAGAVRSFVEIVLGEGAGEKVLPHDSMQAATTVVKAIVGEAQRQMSEVGEITGLLQK